MKKEKKNPGKKLPAWLTDPRLELPLRVVIVAVDVRVDLSLHIDDLGDHIFHALYIARAADNIITHHGCGFRRHILQG